MHAHTSGAETLVLLRERSPTDKPSKDMEKVVSFLLSRFLSGKDSLLLSPLEISNPGFCNNCPTAAKAIFAYQLAHFCHRQKDDWVGCLCIEFV